MWQLLLTIESSEQLSWTFLTRRSMSKLSRNCKKSKCSLVKLSSLPKKVFDNFQPMIWYTGIKTNTYGITINANQMQCRYSNREVVSWSKVSDNGSVTIQKRPEGHSNGNVYACQCQYSKPRSQRKFAKVLIMKSWPIFGFIRFHLQLQCHGDWLNKQRWLSAWVTLTGEKICCRS